MESYFLIHTMNMSGFLPVERFRLNIMFILSGPHLMITYEIFQEALNILLCWRTVLLFPWKSPDLEAKMPPKCQLWGVELFFEKIWSNNIREYWFSSWRLKHLLHASIEGWAKFSAEPVHFFVVWVTKKNNLQKIFWPVNKAT